MELTTTFSCFAPCAALANMHSMTVMVKINENFIVVDDERMGDEMILFYCGVNFVRVDSSVSKRIDILTKLKW